MVGKGNSFSRNYSTSDNPKTSFPEERINPEIVEHLYQVPFEVVDHFRIYTRLYVKKLGGLQTILELPRRGDYRRTPTYIEDSILVGNLEELVNLSLQQIVQPLDQLGPDSLYCSIFQSPIHCPPQSHPQIMAGNVNANVN